MLLSRRTSNALAPLFRAYATTSTTGPTQPNATSPLSNVKPIRMQKAEGSIADVFTSLTGEKAPPLPPRFADLKNLLWKESLVQSWREVLSELEVAVQRVSQQGGNIIPRLSYDDIVKGPSANQIQAIKDTGTVIVAGAVKKEEALAWKESVKDYIRANPVKGFPSDNIQAYELYNSKSQIAARTHPAILNTQKFLLSLWHTSKPSDEIDLSIPISYFDRLRIRTPGDQSFKLGPHVDGGAIERWEDPQFRQVWARILNGGSGWRDHDSFDATPRLDAKQDLYNAASQCTVLRCWQGWTSLSKTGPGDGTLRVLPMLPLASAYILLRPFFRPKNTSSSSLAFEDWEIDLESTAFPGSVLGKGQELNEATHPHLRLDKTMISIPEIQPGDQVYWHCDVVHAVESEHRGKEDSSVLYIPAVPLSTKNASYLRSQRDHFLDGIPAPDFPGGEGESKFSGRANSQDVQTTAARQALGLEPFTQNSAVAQTANAILH